MARMSFQNIMNPMQYANLYKNKWKSRYLIFNLITSKLYTTSLLSKLNSRQGWGYDTSENKDGEFDVITDMIGSGLRFASDSQSTFDGTSVVITTSPVSSLFFFIVSL